MKLELKKFDITSISDDRVVVLIGKRNTGKSFLVRDLLSTHTSLPIGTVISATEKVNKFYSNMIPHILIHDEFQPKIIENVVKRQEAVFDKKQQEVDTYGGSSIDTRAFLILDDCLYDSSWAKDKNIRFLFMNGRHIHCMFIITMQYPLGVPPSLRTNIDYVFILRENYLSNRKRIYENFAGMFPTFETFCTVMDQCTQNYECLVIDNTKSSTKLEEVVFWYKAENKPQFQLCSPMYWEMAAKVGKKKSDEQEYDENAFKKKSPIINVKKRDY